MEKQREEGEIVYEAVSWTIETQWIDNIEERILSGKAAWLEKATTEAFAIAAAEARAIRDNLLAESDSLMALDRLGLSAPSGSTFTAWLSFLRKLGEVLVGNIAIYRQALRDLPNQPGFPYDIQWPVKP